jgi:site-specific recombinase XerD
VAEQIQELPGHAKLETTQTYSESSAELIQASY